MYYFPSTVLSSVDSDVDMRDKASAHPSFSSQCSRAGAPAAAAAAYTAASAVTVKESQVTKVFSKKVRTSTQEEIDPHSFQINPGYINPRFLSLTVCCLQSFWVQIGNRNHSSYFKQKMI